MMKSIPGESIRQEVDQTGFAIVPDVLTTETVDDVTAAIERALAKSGQSTHAMRHLLEAVPEVQEVVGDPMVRRIVASVLGPKAFAVRSIFFDKTPEANWKVAWHQDLTIAVRKKTEVDGYTAWSVKDGVVHVQPPVSLLERMATVRLHLDDCGPDNGPLQVVPNSHKAGRLTTQQISAWRAREKPIPCIVPRGGALLMRPLLLHASSSATVPAHRRVVHLEFASEWLPGGLEWIRYARNSKRNRAHSAH
jgi:ectoine hydroxylase-related dioxygenase (phytanoyl-CoA dioxygenase family)